jgi:LuxR family maltose regulon positive regulatory protein
LRALLQTKLMIPPASQNQVLRPRLTGQLNEASHCALTLVSAPAGSGKTTLLAEWASQCDCPVAWISLDRGDNDPARFESYLAEALRSLGLELRDRHRPETDSLDDILKSTLVATINQLVEEQLEPALVLDDYHLIDNPTIHTALIYSIENLPPGARLVLSTRVDPPFPLARLRGRGQLAELRFDRLRFTSQEAAAFLGSRLDDQLAAQEVESLNQRAEGWVSGLQLAALSLKGSQDPHGLVASFTGSQRYVLDYLVDEVYDQQTREVRDFLLESSILEHLSGPLCSAVTGQRDSEAMLKYLEGANLFLIPLDQERRWYRYHHLFAEALRQRLAWGSPQVLSELHLRAANWYATNGLPAETIEHALAAGDPRQAADYIERFAEGFWMKSQVTSLLRWIRALPPGDRRARPRLGLWEAWMLLLTGDWQPVDPILESVAGRLEGCQTGTDEPGQPEPGELSGMLAAVRAFRANTLGHTGDAIHQAHQALERLPENDHNWRGTVAQILGDAYRMQGDLPSASQAYTRADAASRRARNVFSVLVSLRYQAETQVQTGCLQQAEATFQKALGYARRHHAQGLSATGTVQISLGDLYYRKGELERARRHLEAGLTVCQAAGHGIGMVLANCALARWQHAVGEDQKAYRNLDRAEQLTESHDLEQLTWYPQSLRALFHLDGAMRDGSAEGAPDRARLEVAERWAAGSGLKIDEDPSPVGLRQLVFARLLVLQGMLEGEYGPALGYLDAILEAANREDKAEPQVVAWILRARALNRRGDAQGCIQALARALEAGEEQGFVQAFLDEGPEITHLLRQFLAQMPQHPAAGLAAQVLGRSGRREAGAEGVLDQLFSRREVEVLHLMVEGRTNRQIADELVVAESTVKTHLRHIYRKLKVGNRTEAVHRLQSMNLLPAS